MASYFYKVKSVRVKLLKASDSESRCKKVVLRTRKMPFVVVHDCCFHRI
jgi:hypothetical protein